jgi:cell division protease FtsH
MKNYQTTGVLITGLLLISVLFASTLLMNQGTEKIQELSYTEFMKKLDAGEIARVVVEGQDVQAIAEPKLAAKVVGKTPQASQAASEGTPEKPADAKAGTSRRILSGILAKGKAEDGEAVMRYHVLMPQGSTEYWLPKIEKSNAVIEVKSPDKEAFWWNIATSLILPIMLVVLFLAIFRNVASGGSQAMSFGKSRAKMMMESNIKVKFGDVAGIDEAKEELEEVVDFLKNAERYQKLGAKIPKGVLLVGSPGTGKTLLAKAVAGEAGVPFFSISGSDFVEMFVGVGASRVRDLFEQAKKNAPCIVFIDEIDAVGRQRGAGMGGGHDEREQTLNQMLVEMDGFDSQTGIIIIAATNRPDILDNALLRPGRFDRRVMIDKPDLKGRESILEVHSKGKPLAENVELRKLARRTSGFSGADLANLLNEAALLAARRDKTEIEMRDVEDSIDRVVMGLEKKSKIIKEKDKEATAYHEIGHALTGYLTEGQDPLRKVTIIPRGYALGYAWYAPEEEFEKVSVTKKELLGNIAVSLAGRIAEEIVYGKENVSTGAANDLMQVGKIARNIVTTYGMSDVLGAIPYGEKNSQLGFDDMLRNSPHYSDEVAKQIDDEVKRIVNEQYQYVTGLLTRHRDLMERLTRILLEKETLDGDEFKAIVESFLGNQVTASAENA